MPEINNSMITNPQIQKIKILKGCHDNLTYDQPETIIALSKEFIESL